MCYISINYVNKKYLIFLNYYEVLYLTYIFPQLDMIDILLFYSKYQLYMQFKINFKSY